MERKILTSRTTAPSGWQRTALQIGAWINLLLAVGHLLCLLAPGRIFRLYGIEHTMSRIAAIAPSLPSWIIVGVAGGLLVCALYGFAGAGLHLPLPRVRPLVLTIGALFLLRALGGAALMLILHSSPATKWSAALIAGILGTLYLAGGRGITKKQNA